MREQLPKVYDVHSSEKEIYEMWEKGGYFTPSDDHTKKPFCMVIPPPNVTGKLHMGHALNNTLQDIIIRTKRMQGYNALWVPGTDHAGIATQIKVEEALRVDEHLSRFDLGRDAFVERVWEWKHKYRDNIKTQLCRLGASCDWTRERFTMDETLSRAVRKTFVSLYHKGYIYRGYRIANWCPHCTTALSDTEVEYREKAGGLWHIRYPVKDSDEGIIVATTRPETMLGDTAIAVHPEDERYCHLVGKTAILPLVGREIPIVADEYVEREFGTGCVKITPCQDPYDFEISVRHHLEQIPVIDEHARINRNGGAYEGLDRDEARQRVVQDLQAGGYLVGVEEYTHNVGHCYRCGTVIEPLASEQWFVRMEELAKPAIQVVKEGKIRYIPDRFAKIYLNWMENIHDWCISRQLWWGHRIPAFYCDGCGEVFVSEKDLTACPQCGKGVHQDEDVLDTWFSSALWPFSTLGWPDETEDLKYYYPTNVLVTAYDIITFWVSKMIFSGLEQMHEIPFDAVFIHGLVRDEQGRKMSKSLGNGIDPLDVVEQYGADALRFTLVTGNSPGNDMRFSYDKMDASRNFANKIWNASRFVLMNLEDGAHPVLPAALRIEDKWILHRYNEAVKDITDNIDHYEIGIAAANLYSFVWDCFCDWYIELVKPRLFDKGTQTARDAQSVLSYVLCGILKLLHPFMPFLSENIWGHLGMGTTPLIVAPWPVWEEAHCFSDASTAMERVIGAIKAVRNRRAEMNVAPSKKAKLIVVSNYSDSFNEETSIFFERLASCSCVEYRSSCELDGAVNIVTDSAQLLIPMAEIVDLEQEKQRLEKELRDVAAEMERVQGKLSNASFTEKAPKVVVDAEREKLAKYQQKLRNVKELLLRLK